MPRIFELSVLLGRSSSASDAIAAARTEDTGGITVEMQEFLQGLDESEVLCALQRLTGSVASRSDGESDHARIPDVAITRC